MTIGGGGGAVVFSCSCNSAVRGLAASDTGSLDTVEVAFGELIGRKRVAQAEEEEGVGEPPKMMRADWESEGGIDRVALAAVPTFLSTWRTYTLGGEEEVGGSVGGAPATGDTLAADDVIFELAADIAAGRLMVVVVVAVVKDVVVVGLVAPPFDLGVACCMVSLRIFCPLGAAEAAAVVVARDGDGTCGGGGRVAPKRSEVGLRFVGLRLEAAAAGGSLMLLSFVFTAVSG